MRLDARFPEDADKPIETGMRIAFQGIDGTFECFEIRKPTHKQPEGYVDISAEHIAIAELMDEIIEDKRPSGSAYAALDAALQGTQWSVGTVVETDAHSTTFYYVEVWTALQTIQEVWGVVLEPRIETGPVGITRRYIDIKTRRGADRGVRLELDFNLETAGVTWDDTGLCTALYGFGKGLPISESEAGDIGYSRKLTFEDVEWATSAGYPANKPMGQKWVEDPEATAAYGRNGRIRKGKVYFNDIEAPEELLSATWDALQKRRVPQLTVDAKVVDLRSLGYGGQPLRLGDDVAVVIHPLGIELKAAVTKMKRDLIAADKTQPTIGAYRQDIIDITRQINTTANYGKEIADVNPSLLQGYIDTIVTRVMSSGTNMDTFGNGGLIFTSDDGQSAVLLTGAGILLANSKVDGEWVWRTAIDGMSVNASEIRTGALDAALIRIAGSEGTFWDNNYIQITSKQNLNWIMRYGNYDGINSGLAFSRDGGVTWSTAIGFDGAHFGDTIAGFDIGIDGLTNGNLIQLMSSGYIRLGGFEMDGGDHPYMSFTYNGLKAFHVGEGAFDIDQVFNANGPVYFTNLPKTTHWPNLYIDSSGKLFESTWTPGSTGGGESVSVSLSSYTASIGSAVTATVNVTGLTATMFHFALYENEEITVLTDKATNTFTFYPQVNGTYRVWVDVETTSGTHGAGSAVCSVGGSGLSVQVSANAASVPVGTQVVWQASAIGATGAVSWYFEIISPNGLYDSGNSNFVALTVNAAGAWYARFTATDSATQASATGGSVTVTGGGGGTPTSGTTTASNVNIRSSPNTNASITATIGTAGTRVVITGALVADSMGGSMPWWPISWDYNLEHYIGYIRSDYLSPNY